MPDDDPHVSLPDNRWMADGVVETFVNCAVFLNSTSPPNNHILSLYPPLLPYCSRHLIALMDTTQPSIGHLQPNPPKQAELGPATASTDTKLSMPVSVYVNVESRSHLNIDYLRALSLTRGSRTTFIVAICHGVFLPATAHLNLTSMTPTCSWLYRNQCSRHLPRRLHLFKHH
jgi:hypothetical protein